MALVASPSSWTSSLPYAPNQQPRHTPLRPQSATWNTKFPALSLDLTVPRQMPVYTSTSPSTSYVPAKPRLRLAVQVVVPSHEEKLPSRRFDPFADEPPVASTSQLQNVAPAPAPSHLARGRPLTPLCISSPLPPASPSPPTGRRRAPSFSAGSGAPLPRTRDLSSLSSLTLSSQLCSAPSPAPSLTRIAPPQAKPKAEAPPVPLAPTPFHARHYPTPDARARLLARTLLNRIHAVGRPRSMYSCSAYAKTNGYESECGSRGYVRSRLSEVTMAC